MQFSFPCHFNKKEIQILVELNNSFKKNKVSEFYGSLNPNIFGSGRITEMLPEVSLKQFIKFISYINNYKIKFNYTLNQFCMSGEEFSKEGYNKIILLVELLNELGISSITVSIPSIIELLSKRYSNIEICASTIMRIDSADKAKMIEDLGAKRIILFEDINRSFETIYQIRKSVNASLEILVNSPCVFSCPYREYHYAVQGHVKGDTAINADLWFLKCNVNKLKNREILIKSRGIVRPEDIYIYEDIGIEYAKIVGREECIDNSLLTANKYLSEEHEGNYFDLLPLRKGTKQAFYIDNKLMKDFIKYFLEGKNTCSTGCINCGYCMKYAKKITTTISDNILNAQIIALEKQTNSRSYE